MEAGWPCHACAVHPLTEAQEITGVSTQVLDKLNDFVTTEKFLERLGQVRAIGQVKEDKLAGIEHLAAEDKFANGQPAMDDFVLVEKIDAVEALAFYIASFLTSSPEAQNMTPIELQRALAATLQDLKKSRWRAVWEWSRFAYRWSAVGYSALKVYQNPWLVRAVLAALRTGSYLALGLVF